MNELSIVIVNWNAGPQLAACVHSILLSDQQGFSLAKIVVVDNGSTDNSLGLLPSSEHLSVIQDGVNYGFAKACNLGAAQVTSRFILFLNPDTCLNPDTLDKTITFFCEKSQALDFGILGIQLFYANGLLQPTCSRFPSLKSIFFDATGLSRYFTSLGQSLAEFNHQTSRQVDQVIGAFFFLELNLFNSLHGFDEQFFVYYEEVDFAYRCSRQGIQSYFYAGARALHLGGGCSAQVKAKRLFYSLQSRVAYITKHFSRRAALLAKFLTLVIEPFPRMVLCFVKLNFRGIMETLQAYRAVYIQLWRSRK